MSTTPRVLRERAGLTAVDVAAKARISMGAVVRVEAGRGVGVETLLKYASAVGVSLVTLVKAWLSARGAKAAA